LLLPENELGQKETELLLPAQKINQGYLSPKVFDGQRPLCSILLTTWGFKKGKKRNK